MVWYDRMCAGATVFSPLSRFRVSSTNYSRIAVVGVGGLGHLAIQFAAALGATVTAISTSEKKRADAMKLGAKHYIISSDEDAMTKASRSFDMVLCCADIPQKDFDKYLKLTEIQGQFVLVGMGNEKRHAMFDFYILQTSDTSFTGSIIAPPSTIKEMLDLAATHKIYPMIEQFPMHDVNHALHQVKHNNIRYRAVLVNGKI
jgi:alcohol dehydrogenase (NADP+)